MQTSRVWREKLLKNCKLSRRFTVDKHFTAILRSDSFFITSISLMQLIYFPLAPDCESCPFDFTGALTSLYVMLVVLLAVLTPMLVVLILVITLRCCCPKYINKGRNRRSGSESADMPDNHRGLIH